MGVLPTVTGRSTALTLDVGDTVMMVSDGALCDGSAWLCDQLTLSTRLGQSPQQTAEAVAASAVRRSGARQDDIMGQLPVWHLMGNETNCMVGNPGIPVAEILLDGVSSVLSANA